MVERSLAQNLHLEIISSSLTSLASNAGSEITYQMMAKFISIFVQYCKRSVTVHLTVDRLIQKYVICIQDKFGSW